MSIPDGQYALIESVPTHQISGYEPTPEAISVVEEVRAASSGVNPVRASYLSTILLLGFKDTLRLVVKGGG